MLYCFRFQLIKGSCYLLRTENISSFQETLWSGCKRGTTTDISGDNEHYKQYENEKNVRTFCSEESPIFFPLKNEGHAKPDFSCDLPFIGKHLPFHESFPPNREAQAAAGLSRIVRCFFIFLFCFLCSSSLQIPRLGQVCQLKQGSSSGAADSPRPGPFPSLHARPQPFGSNLSTHSQDRPMCPGGMSAPWPQRQGTVACCRAGSSGFAWWWCWWEQLLAGRHCLQTLAGGCSLHRSTFCPGRPSPYIHGTAQVNAGGKGFQQGKLGACFSKLSWYWIGSN